MKKLLLILLVGIFVHFFSPLFSQDIEDLEYDENLVDEVAGFGGFSSGVGNSGIIGSESMVDLPTLRAQYSIPLLKHAAGQASISLSLNYMSGGVQLEKFAGWVGMDWNLSGMGYIERELNGLEDERPKNGYIDFAEDNISNFETNSKEEKSDVIDKAVSGDYDTEADLFHFSFGGYSGYFVFNHDGEINTVPKYDFIFEDVEFEEYVIKAPFPSWNITRKRINGFTVIDNRGIKYTFGYDTDAVETTTISTFINKARLHTDGYNITNEWDHSNPLDPIKHRMSKPKLVFTTLYGVGYNPELRFHNKNPFSGKSMSINSKWYLTSIIYPDNSSLSYNYKHLGVDSYTTGERIVKTNVNAKLALVDKTYDMNGELWNYEYNLVRNYLNTGEEVIGKKIFNIANYQLQINKETKVKKYLADIVFSDGTRIDFITSTSRDDANLAIRLEAIKFYSYENIPVKFIDFNYETIVSKSLTEEANDPFNLMEAFVFKGNNFNYTGPMNHVPAHLCLSQTSYIQNLPHWGHYQTYLLEGLKPYNYKRLYLKGISIKGVGNQSNTVKFNYYSPELLYRRTSSLKNKWGIQAAGAHGVDTYLKPTNGQVFLPAIKTSLGLITKGAYYGMLKSVELSSGGLIEYNYKVNAGGTIIIDNIKSYKESGGGADFTDSYSTHSGLWANSAMSANYSIFVNENIYEAQPVGSLKEFKPGRDVYTIRTNYNLVNGNYTNGSPVVYTNVEVNRNESLAKVVYEFLLNKDDANLTFYSPTVTSDEVLEYTSDYCDQLVGWDDPKCMKLNWDFATMEGGANTLPRLSSNHIQRGLLKRVRYYSNTSEIKKVEYDYNFEEAGFTKNAKSISVRCSKLGYYTMPVVDGKDATFGNCALRFDFHDIRYGTVYKHYSDRVLTIRKITSEKRIGDWISSTENYEYESGLLKRKYSETSDGRSISTEYKYPLDYSLDQDCPSGYGVLGTGINLLVDKHIINQPIEIINKLENKIVSGSINTFKEAIPYGYNPPFPVLSKVYQFETQTPISTDDYIESNTTFSTTVMPLGSPICQVSFNFDERYFKEKSSMDLYDDFGNLLQSHSPNGNYSSVLYGYNNTLPIAKASNAKYNQIYFTSFEGEKSEQANRTTDQAHNGKYSYVLNSSNGWVNFCQVDISAKEVSDNYKLSTWYRSENLANGTSVANFGYYVYDGGDNELKALSYFLSETSSEWKLFSFDIDMAQIKADNPGVTTFKIKAVAYNRDNHSVYFDDFRLQPKEARMTTYTHKPLVGVTSETDANNKTVRYEYDGLGRLIRTFDHKGNLIEENKYHYKNQASYK